MQVRILANLWNAPDGGDAPGCSTVGSSEACMLGGLALKRRWLAKRKAQGKGAEGAKPNIVMGGNVQVCWERFANYFEVEERLVPMEGDRCAAPGFFFIQPDLGQPAFWTRRHVPRPCFMVIYATELCRLHAAHTDKIYREEKAQLQAAHAT